MSYLKDWQTNRLQLPYDIDGIVFKANLLKHQEALGTTAKSPKYFER